MGGLNPKGKHSDIWCWLSRGERHPRACEEVPSPASPPSLPATGHPTSIRHRSPSRVSHRFTPLCLRSHWGKRLPTPQAPSAHTRTLPSDGASVCPSPTVTSSRAPTGPQTDETFPCTEALSHRCHLYAPNPARSSYCGRASASVPALHPSSCFCDSPDYSKFIVPLTHRQLGQALLMGLISQYPLKGWHQ